MYSIEKETQFTLEIKKSKFIACLFPIFDQSEINLYLEQVKKEYPNATHYCYAYSLFSKSKYSDDHEPHGTAGAPILNVIEKKNLDCLLCVVIRYFGGIKLGANGLVRAYSKVTSQALETASVIELIPSYIIKVVLSYEQRNAFLLLAKSYRILDTTYEEKITYQLEIPTDDLPLFKEYNPEILGNRYMKKTTFA